MQAKRFTIRTPREGFINITRNVQQVIAESGAKSGVVVVWCPHTTAGITVNENADPDVVTDMLYGLDKAYPDRPEFRHAEGNSTISVTTRASMPANISTNMVNFTTKNMPTLTNINFIRSEPLLYLFFISSIIPTAE